MKMLQESLPYLNQAQDLANGHGLYTLESLVGTRMGHYLITQNKIQNAIYRFQIWVSAVINNIYDDTWVYVLRAIAPLLSALFKYTLYEDNGKEVEYLLREHKVASEHVTKTSNESFITSQLNEIVFQVRYYEVVHNPIMFTRMNYITWT